MSADVQSLCGCEVTIISSVSPPRGNVPDPLRRERLPPLKALTSIRFFAALHVALYHLVRPFSLWGRLAPFFGSGYTAVSFFFVLSGFILTYSHGFEYERGEGTPKSFYIARLARIYPVYLLTTMAAAWVMREQFAKSLHVFAFAADILAVQSWSIRTANFFNYPAWSISNEAFFYLLFPYVLLLLRPTSRARAISAIMIFWVLSIAAPLYALWRFPVLSWNESGPTSAPGTHTIFWIRRTPVLALPEFLAGISLGWLYLQFRPSWRRASGIPWAGVLATLSALYFSGHFPFVLLHNGLLIPLSALAILGLSYDNVLTRLLSPKWLTLLGEASFSLYLIHVPFNVWWSRHFGQELTIASALVKLSFVVPISILLHLIVERPCRRIILKRWLPHRSG